MTDIAFHFNIHDKLAYACRLLRKASRQGVKLTITGEEHQLKLLDEALWTFEPSEFLPHCTSSCPPYIVQNTAIMLTTDIRQSTHADVLINLGREMPEGFERYLRLVELVGADEVEKEPARQRWRYYKSRGYSINQFEINR